MKKLRSFFAINLCMEMKKFRWETRALAEAFGIEVGKDKEKQRDRK